MGICACHVEEKQTRMCVCARLAEMTKKGRLRERTLILTHSGEYVRHQSIGAWTFFCVCVCAGRVD